MTCKRHALANRCIGARLVLVALAGWLALVATPASALLRIYATTNTNHLISFYDVSGTPFADKTAWTKIRSFMNTWCGTTWAP